MQDRCTVCTEHTKSLEIILDAHNRTPKIGPNLVLFRLETVLGSVHDCCTVCAKRTIGSEIMHPMVLLGDEAQVKARFGPF
jgi:hypothetical protein